MRMNEKNVRDIAFQISRLCSDERGEGGAFVLNTGCLVVLPKPPSLGTQIRRLLPLSFHCVVHKTVYFPNVTFVFSLLLFATA